MATYRQESGGTELKAEKVGQRKMITVETEEVIQNP